MRTTASCFVFTRQYPKFDHTVGRQTSLGSKHARQFVPGRSCPVRKLPDKQADKQAGLSRHHPDSIRTERTNLEFFQLKGRSWQGFSSSLLTCLALSWADQGLHPWTVARGGGGGGDINFDIILGGYHEQKRKDKLICISLSQNMGACFFFLRNNTYNFTIAG